MHQASRLLNRWSVVGNVAASPVRFRLAAASAFASPGVGEFKPSAGFTCFSDRARPLFALASEPCQWPNQRLQPTRIPPLRGSMRSAEAERSTSKESR